MNEYEAHKKDKQQLADLQNQIQQRFSSEAFRKQILAVAEKHLDEAKQIYLDLNLPFTEHLDDQKNRVGISFGQFKPQRSQRKKSADNQPRRKGVDDSDAVEAIVEAVAAGASEGLNFTSIATTTGLNKIRVSKLVKANPDKFTITGHLRSSRVVLSRSA